MIGELSRLGVLSLVEVIMQEAPLKFPHRHIIKYHTDIITSQMITKIHYDLLLFSLIGATHKLQNWLLCVIMISLRGNFPLVTLDDDLTMRKHNHEVESAIVTRILIKASH